MASKQPEVAAEQKQLAEFIKATHVNLRKESGVYGANEAWQRHVANTDVLQSYAASMKKLATQYWAKAAGSRQKVHCRIDWVKTQCRDYFLNGGEERFMLREADIKSKLEPQSGSAIEYAKLNSKVGSEVNNDGAIKLLDIGSCCEVTAAGLAPSAPRNALVASEVAPVQASQLTQPPTSDSSMNPSGVAGVALNKARLGEIELLDGNMLIDPRSETEDEILGDKDSTVKQKPTANSSEKEELTEASELTTIKVSKMEDMSVEDSKLPQPSSSLLKRSRSEEADVGLEPSFLKEELAERRLISKISKEDSEDSQLTQAKLEIEVPPKEPIKLLDVGSCYNPFQGDPTFQVTAVDLAPSSASVLQCDFLNVPVGSTLSTNDNALTQLPSQHFDAVVFCLLLEYLPSAEQRHSCCVKAWQVLRPGGLLVIVTPDSKHVGANARFMRSWRFALSKLGLMRVRYEKLPHMHCLAYRKCRHAEVARRWATLQTIAPGDELLACDGKLYIPQDFQEREETEGEGRKRTERSDGDGGFDAATLDQLPFNDEKVLC